MDVSRRVDVSKMCKEPLDRDFIDTRGRENESGIAVLTVRNKLFREYVRSDPLDVRRAACVTGGSSRNEIKLIFGHGQRAVYRAAEYTTVRHCRC